MSGLVDVDYHDIARRAEIALHNTKEGEVIDFAKMAKPWASAWGKLTPIQEGIVAEHVKGRVVHDIYAGSTWLSHEMLRMGAKKIHAIDSKLSPPDGSELFFGAKCDPRIVQYPITVEEFLRRRTGKFVNAFISWPDNQKFCSRGIGFLLARFSKVIYLGCNTGGTSCGSEALWNDLLTREVLEYAPDRSNTLIVYGQKRHFRRRQMMGEEIAAWKRKVISYDLAEELQCEVIVSQGKVKAVQSLMNGKWP